MKKINFLIIEVAITISLLIFLFLLTTPFAHSMPSTMLYVFGFVGIAWLVIFTLFFIKDPSEDERDLTHIKFASKLAFIIGVAVLMIGTFMQSLNNQLDIILPITLGIMLLSKTLGIIYKRVTD